MKLNAGDSEDLKKIISDTLGHNVSKTLLGSMHSLLDEDHKDHDSLKKTCRKIEKMVGLFHGADKAKIMNERFTASLLRIK